MGKGVGGERRDVTDSPRVKGSLGRDVMLLRVQGLKGSFWRSIILYNVRGKVSFRRDVMLQTVQG